MPDLDNVHAPEELATPAIPEQQPEAETPQDIVDPELSGDAVSNGDNLDAPEIEYTTIERNGKTYQVPKELESEFLMQADYTRKTQSVAEQAKALEERAQRITQQAELAEGEMAERAKLYAIDEALKKYEGVDLEQLAQTDPFGSQQAIARLFQLQQMRNASQAELNKFASQRTEFAQQELAKRVQETEAFAQKNIPNWKPELNDQIVNYALSEGVTPQFLQQNMSPMLYKFLHRAMVGDQLMKRNATPKPAQTPPTAPLKVVTGKAAPSTPRTLAELAKSDDISAYAEARRKNAGR